LLRRGLIIFAKLLMGKIYNRFSEREKRKRLRNNATRAEEILWDELKDKKMMGYKFRRQYSIGSYVVDFYCPELKLAIEVDGTTHVTADEIEYDRNREKEIGNLNIEFLRFTNEEVYENLENVLEKIRIKIS
jgi:very-short-patch-repair endonuclease